jgi:hypothetical protein
LAVFFITLIRLKSDALGGIVELQARSPDSDTGPLFAEFSVTAENPVVLIIGEAARLFPVLRGIAGADVLEGVTILPALFPGDSIQATQEMIEAMSA